MKCALCKVELIEANDSKEHLIPAAIGGYRKVSGFICRVCNNTAGAEWDAELARQLSFLTLMFGVRRERGDAPSKPVMSVDGERWQLHPHGDLGLVRPDVKKKIIGPGQIAYEVKARTPEETREIVQGIARKFPGLDIEKVLSGAQARAVHPGVLQIPLSFGGSAAGKSVLKSALCLAVAEGVDVDTCPEATRCLGDKDGDDCFALYYSKDLLSDRSAGSPIHCIAVSSMGADGQLLGYVEYFGAYRFLVRLAKQYAGPAIQSTYAIDPRTGATLNVQLDLSLSQAYVDDALAHMHMPLASVRAAFESILGPMMEMQQQRKRQELIKEAVDYAFANCGAAEGAEITPDQRATLFRLLQEKLISGLERYMGGPAEN